MAAAMVVRSLYQSEPPDLQTKEDMNPTLLVSWWCTGFALVVILIRVCGRYVRTEKLFREDWIMFGSIAPLLIRMGLVHVVLIWGTNNTKTVGLTNIEIEHRSTGSKIVLASRIFYALFIWMAKWSILEFLKRLVGAFWHKSYEIGLQFIRYFLVATFTAALISTLAECHPFDHYWQVIPDPGPHCREGIAQLMTMGICDIITDIVLVVFPIPIVIRSEMPLKRKISLVLLFGLSLGLVGVTAYRVPATIDRRSAQQFRTVVASFEILAAAGVTNAVVIGSFIRDRGVKKAKYKRGSLGGGSTNEQDSAAVTRRQTVTVHHWGSDEDLVRDMGMALHPTLQHRNTTQQMPRAAPVAIPNHNTSGDLTDIDETETTANTNRQFASTGGARDRSETGSVSSNSNDTKSVDINAQVSAEPISPGEAVPETPASRKPSFFDVGGLLEHNIPSSPPSAEPLIQGTRGASIPDSQRSFQSSQQGSRAFIADVGGLLSPHREESDKDRSIALPPSAKQRSSPQPPPPQSGSGRNFSRGSTPYNSRTSVVEQHVEPQPLYRPGRDVGPSEIDHHTLGKGVDALDFVDVGGLLK